MSLYGPTFHVTPVDLCIIFQCNLHIYPVSSLVEIKLFQNCFKSVRIFGIHTGCRRYDIASYSINWKLFYKSI